MTARAWAVRCLAILCLAPAACKKASTPATSGASSQATPSGAAPGGGAPATLPRRPLKDIATVYDVTYTPETVVLSAETVQHSLKSTSPDETTFTFAAGSSEVSALKPGSVMLLTGRAIRRVTAVQPMGDSVVVQTGSAEITDAIQNGNIKAQTTVDFGTLAAALLPAPVHHDPFSDFSFVRSAYAETQTGNLGPLNCANGSQFNSCFSVQIDPFTYTVKFTPAAGQLNIAMTIENTVDKMSVTATGYLKNYQAVINMLIQNKQITTLDFENSGLEGEVTVNWTAVTLVAGPLAKIASWSDLLVKYQPLRQSGFTFNFLIGPIPFEIKFSAGIVFTPAFTSKNSTLNGSLTVHYSGSGGFTVNHGTPQANGSIAQATQKNPMTQILSLGPIGFTVAVEFPRVELGVGISVVTFSPTAYINQVTSFGLVYGGPASMLPCETHILDVSVNTGISTASTLASFFGTPTKLNFAKQIYFKHNEGPAPGMMLCPK